MTSSLSEEALFELMSLECRVDSYGNVKYHNALGELHRVHGPAVENTNSGAREWWQNGLLHRLDGPAVEYPDGSKFWYQNGQLHRLDGPAVEYSDGECAWYQNGQLHRLDGPAVETSTGSKFWYINGKELSVSEWQHAASMERV